jgi:hypothetical protein
VIRTENEKILAEEVGRPIAEVARGRAYLSECAVYGKGLRQVFALWVRPRAKVVVHGFVEPQPLLQWWKKQESPCFSCGECQDLVELYGVNEVTSEKAKALMKAKLDEVEEVIRKIKEG